MPNDDAKIVRETRPDVEDGTDVDVGEGDRHGPDITPTIVKGNGKHRKGSFSKPIGGQAKPGKASGERAAASEPAGIKATDGKANAGKRTDAKATNGKANAGKATASSAGTDQSSALDVASPSSPGAGAERPLQGVKEDVGGLPVERFTLQVMELEAGSPQVFMNPHDAHRLGLHPGDRVRITSADGEASAVALVNLARNLVRKGRLAASIELTELLSLGTGTDVDVRHAPRPDSVDFIKKKLDGHPLSEKEIDTIIEDISHHALSPIEVTAWAVSTYIYDLTLDEVVACVHAMVRNGETVRFEGGPVMDVHSIGGVPGNKYTPLCVPIVAANGLLIPKTSSRAISSACGTADFIEVFCPVEHSAESIKRIGESTGGTMVWGGGVKLAPADDEIIRVEYPLSIDPKGQLLASVLAKKMAVGAKHVVIDIPVGPRNKMKDEAEARALARAFIDVGERLGIQIQVALTNGNQPIGRAIGPILEAKEALATLEGKGPLSLQEKACTLAGMLLELGGACGPGQGHDLAFETLKSGRALAKFREIIGAQGGDPDIRSQDLEAGPYTMQVNAPMEGIVEEVDNHAIIKIARAAGSPRDKGAGIYLHRKRGRRVAKDAPLYTIYAEHEHKLRDAVALANRLKPLKIEGMVVDEIMR